MLPRRSMESSFSDIAGQLGILTILYWNTSLNWIMMREYALWIPSSRMSYLLTYDIIFSWKIAWSTRLMVPPLSRFVASSLINSTLAMFLMELLICPPSCSWNQRSCQFTWALFYIHSLSTLDLQGHRHAWPHSGPLDHPLAPWTFFQKPWFFGDTPDFLLHVRQSLGIFRYVLGHGLWWRKARSGWLWNCIRFL